MYSETDFPDGRCWTFLHSHHGTLMNIPREGDMVRFYIQLPPDTDLVNRETGRVDMAKASAERVIESAREGKKGGRQTEGRHGPELSLHGSTTAARPFCAGECMYISVVDLLLWS